VSFIKHYPSIPSGLFFFPLPLHGMISCATGRTRNRGQSLPLLTTHHHHDNIRARDIFRIAWGET
jgi:hypothetical protein